MRRKITNTQRKVRRRKYTNLRRKDLFLFRTSPGASTHAEWNIWAQNTEYGMFFFSPFLSLNFVFVCVFVQRVIWERPGRGTQSKTNFLSFFLPFTVVKGSWRRWKKNKKRMMRDCYEQEKNDAQHMRAMNILIDRDLFFFREKYNNNMLFSSSSLARLSEEVHDLCVLIDSVT